MSLQHWEDYYRGGALASCPVGPGSGYTQELREIWVEFFSGLPEGARILDIGTGNGVVALIALETATSAGRHHEIHGTDLAQIDAARDVQDGARIFSGIRFHAQVATEKLPFEASSFDAVSGQYALEYTIADQALREIHRVLKPGGQTDNPLMLSVTIDAVQKLLAARQQMRPAALDLEIDRFEGNIRASVHRLQDLIRCGQTEAGMQGLSGLALAQGFEVRELAIQHHAGNTLVGWRLRLVKP